MILYVVTQVAAAMPAYTPPPAPPAPPTMVPYVQVDRAAMAEAITLDVVVRGDRETLFEGPLRVAQSSPATVSREQTEAPSATCNEQRYSYGRATRRLRLQIASTPSTSAERRIAVSASWTRPVDRPCPGDTGSRTVELADTVVLAAGSAATITGDAGLSVTLRRR